MNRVQEIRKKKGIKQYQLAIKVGRYQSLISIIENHGLIPDDELKKKLARALKCEVSDLFPA